MGGSQSSNQADAWFDAAACGDSEALQCIADRVRDCDAKLIDATDARGWTALMIAAAAGHAGCILLLIKSKCLINAQDARGWTAATHAATKGQERCLRLLAEAGASISTKDFLGTTATMRAAIGGYARCLRVLVEHGVDLKATDNMGMTALEHANVRGHVDCVRILRSEKRTSGSNSDSSSRSSSYSTVDGSSFSQEWYSRSSSGSSSHAPACTYDDLDRWRNNAPCTAQQLDDGLSAKFERCGSSPGQPELAKWPLPAW